VAGAAVAGRAVDRAGPASLRERDEFAQVLRRHVVVHDEDVGTLARSETGAKSLFTS
jgi:hypothetical protein